MFILGNCFYNFLASKQLYSRLIKEQAYNINESINYYIIFPRDNKNNLSFGLIIYLLTEF